MPGTYTGVEIRGSLPDGEGTVSVARADQRGQEQYLMDWQWSTAEATDCLNQEITCSPVYIKLYFSAPQLDLYSAGLSGGQDVPYRFYPREGRALFAFFWTVSAISCLIRTKQGFLSRIRPGSGCWKATRPSGAGARFSSASSRACRKLPRWARNPMTARRPRTGNIV
ncbi:MAG: hypothetical protein ACLTYN_00200 [Dysosmobacter welbionis]